MEIIGVHAHNVCKRLAPYLLPAYRQYQDKYTHNCPPVQRHVTCHKHSHSNMSILNGQEWLVTGIFSSKATSGKSQSLSVHCGYSQEFETKSISKSQIQNIFGSLWAINNNLAPVNDKFSTTFQTVSVLNGKCKYLLTLLNPLLYRLYQFYSVSTISKYSDKIIYREECCILT